MTSKELNNKILKIQKLVKQASELKIEQLEKCISNIPSFVGTNLYGDLKNAVILEEKKFIIIERLNNILESISSIISCYCFEKYGLDFEVYNTILHFLKENRYHSKEEQQACFQSQLLDNADNWNIYMRDKLTLVNLLNGSQIVLETEERLREYINENQIICIETKSPYFEKEYQKFYNYLLKHGYEYTTGENAAPVSIAETLANIFNAEVTISKDLLPFYISNFNYPENFNNQRYIDYVQKITQMRKNKEFMKAYKLFCYMKSSMENLHSTFINFKMFQSEVSHNQNTSPHDILFLQRMYTSYHPRFGCGGRTNIDYYKALDMDSFRNNSGQNDIGVWKRCFDPCQKRSSDLEKAKEYLPLSMTYFDWRMFYERTRIYDKELFDEISALEHNCTEQQINELIKDRCVIVSNENLDYTTLLKEYYSNFGMDSVEFSQMIQKKYGCEVKTSEKKTSGTKMMVYSSSHAK